MTSPTKVIIDMDKIFLGGTCNNSTWRKELTIYLQVKYFDPVVEDWTPACQEEEYKQKKLCNIHFYCITSEMTGVFSIAEIIDSVHTKNKITILHVLPKGFDKGQLRSLKAVVDLVKLRGGIAYIDSDLRRSARILNGCWGDINNMITRPT